jgi:DNA/RNA-binding domain of Phe-tRNA-synthetase-like protein
MILVPSRKWKTAYPEASIGVLAMSGVRNPEGSPPLDARKEVLEGELRSRFGSLDRSQLKRHPQLHPYTKYYKRFGKTYHVQHQLESIVFKGKTIPGIAALVEAMFMAELKNLLLTAGHDLATVRGELRVDVASGSETYVTLGGADQTLQAGDMFIRDEVGVLSSILYGPDQRTPITPTTTSVLFTVYAPAGIPQESVRAHLGDLRDSVLVVAPEANVVDLLVVHGGSAG